MLLKKLCDLYDRLLEEGKVTPFSYEGVKVHYLVALNEDGTIADVVDIRDERKTDAGKVYRTPKVLEMPRETHLSGFAAYIPEHRPRYLFGLNEDNGALTPDDGTGKARKSHAMFKSETLLFLEGLDTPLINAYRNFTERWDPDAETKNRFLLALGKDYEKSGFAFCLASDPKRMLQDEPALREKWDGMEHIEPDAMIAECSVTGKVGPIKRTHDVIRLPAAAGGISRGCTLVGTNDNVACSYGRTHADNCNISVEAADKYVKALNYLISSKDHMRVIGNRAVIFWSEDADDATSDIFIDALYGTKDVSRARQLDDMLKDLLRDAESGRIAGERLKDKYGVSAETTFYMLGLRGNDARAEISFFENGRYADILHNIARFQDSLRIAKDDRAVSLYRIAMEVSKDRDKIAKEVTPLVDKLFNCAIHGSPYPGVLITAVLNRIRKERGNVTTVRAGVIRAYINQNGKEDIGMALNKDNKDPAYLCGRLFAVIEQAQYKSSPNLNKTVKDRFFSAASTTPAQIFDGLMRKVQGYLASEKVSEASKVYLDKLIGEIVDKLNGTFPTRLSSYEDQGSFIVGYYQQRQTFFMKKEETALD